jgi:hypothetical protein
MATSAAERAPRRPHRGDRSGFLQAGNACSAELEPGLQARILEPPSGDIEPVTHRTPTAEVTAAWPIPEETRYVVDVLEPDGETRITNHPASVGFAMVRPLVGPDTLTQHPVPPGVSILVGLDGSLSDCAVFLEPGPVVDAAWGELTYASFLVHNLSPVEVSLTLEAEDSHGWVSWPGSVPLVLQAAQVEEVLVPVEVPAQSDPWLTMVVLNVWDDADIAHVYRAGVPVRAGRASLDGVVSYPGGFSGTIQVAAYEDWSHPFFDYAYPVLLEDAGPYELDGMAPGTYVVAGFLDMDGNGRPSAGEPVGFYDPGADGIPDPLALGPGEHASGIDFTLGDTYVPPDWADHNVGNCVLTVTDQGILGFMDDTQVDGSGFVYPQGGNNQLFIGGPWIGLDPAYIANREYSADPAQELVVSTVPDGHVWADHPGLSDQDYRAIFTDAAGTPPRGLVVEQLSMAYGAPETAGDFVLLHYRLVNDSADPLPEVYFGVFLDFDLGSSATDDEGAVIPDARLVYMGDGEGIYTAVQVLDPGGRTVPVANLTLVHNPTYVWPNQYVLDPDKWAFLSAADPEHVLTESFQPDDYSVLASVGPLALGPGESQEVAFAVVAGMGLDALLEHALVAQMTYLDGVADVEDPTQPAVVRLLPPQPHPVVSRTTVRFVLAERQRVRLSVHDARGRRVGTLVDGDRAAGSHALTWDPRASNLPAGVYFLRLETASGVWARKVVVAR